MQQQAINSYSELFKAFNKLRVLVIGDVMIDSYLWGHVNRISPEAPVPVVSVDKRENRLGGAANVALNIKSLGAVPVLCSVIGDDIKGEEFIDILSSLNLPTSGIIQSSKRITTTKFRVLGNKVQMLRVDEESTESLHASDRNALVNRFTQILETAKTDVILFQDYDKGLIDKELIEQVVKKARELNIPVVVDPKRRNFSHYQGVTLFKPNLKELCEGLNTEIDAHDVRQLISASAQLKKKLKAAMVMITLSELGVFIDAGEKAEAKHIIPSHIRNIADVSGAGDTVIAVASLCLGLGYPADKMAQIANLAGGLVCEKAGVVPIDKEQLKQEVKKLGL